jgi:hypothetical protein
MSRFHNSLVRSFRFIIEFDSFRSNSFFREEFNRGAEEVMEEPPLPGVEFIE